MGVFRVQCQGTYLNYTALSEDGLSVFLIHDTDVSDQEIIGVLSACTAISSNEFPKPETNIFYCSILLHDLGPKIKGKGPEPGESRVFKCAVEIVRLSSNLRWEE